MARQYGISQGWISLLVARYRAEGDAVFEPHSRRPHSSPTRLPQSTIDLIVELRHTVDGKGLDNGPHAIAWHLQQHHRGQTTQIVLHPLRRRTTQPTLTSRLVQDHNITIINAATGEVLRDFTLDPASDYQPTGARKGPTRKKPRT